jgi:hypothetical protein
MFKFIITFSLVGKAHKGRTFPKYWAELYFHLLLGPLFYECPHPCTLPYTLDLFTNESFQNTAFT